mgnify:CR=1 FL=1
MSQIIAVGENIYEVFRIIKSRTVKGDPELVKAWAEFHRCDRAFKHGEDLYFLVKDIDDAQIIEDTQITENTLQNEEVSTTE